MHRPEPVPTIAVLAGDDGLLEADALADAEVLVEVVGVGLPLPPPGGR
jgi:hypothetical protein